MSKKTSRGAAAKISSTSAVSSTSQRGPKSSVLKSAFTPSYLQLALFASVIQGLESQNLRIHNFKSGRLQCQHNVQPGTTITSLDWGYAYREDGPQESKKKRKRGQSKEEHVVLAYGTSTSEICLLSPAENKVVGRLAGGHERGIRAFKFSPEKPGEAWSIGGDGKLIQWDLKTSQPTRSISLTDASIATLAPPSLSTPQILCASSTPFAIALESSGDFRIEKYDSFKGAIHSLFRSGTDHENPEETFLALDADRYINIYDIARRKLVRSLIVGGEVTTADFFKSPPETMEYLKQQLLAVLRRDGIVELFVQPFAQNEPTLVNGDIKSKRKTLTRKSNAQVKFVRQDASDQAFSVVDASLQGPELLVAIADGGVEVSFQKLRWQDEGNGQLLFSGTKESVCAPRSSALNKATMNGVKDLGMSHVDESKTVVVNGGAEGSSEHAAIEIESSDGEEELEEAASDDDEDLPEQAALAPVEDDQSDSDADTDMEEAGGAPVLAEDPEMHGSFGGDEAEQEEPSFGELLASRKQGLISIADGLPTDSPTLLASDGTKPLAIPTGMSLTTVLTQSLRTNDQNLLESCLHSSETDVIKATIQRLDSSLAGLLLQKLAERLASRPGRYGHLMIWVQWICVVHGGAIAGRPDVSPKIRTLYRVLSERARSLDSLLLLKGKLDMLDAQLSFRRQLQAQRPRDPQEEAGVIYLEGDDNWSSDEEEEVVAPRASTKAKLPRKPLEELVADSESEDDEDMPMTNGVSHSDSENEEDAGSDEGALEKVEGGLLDDEAEESGDSDEGEELDSEDEEDDEDSEGSDSDMDSFINDDSIDAVEDEGDVDIDGDDTPEKPATKRARKA